MSKIYVCGDTHMPYDINKLNTTNFPEQKELIKDDYVIICGDFGLLWDWKETGVSVESNPLDKCWTKEELYWKQWLEDKPWTTLFIDGNHENHDRLGTYPVVEWGGARVHKISDSIIHLMRGEIYKIGNYSILTCGGAMSMDRGPATLTEELDAHRIWWPQETLKSNEYEYMIDNLNAHNNKVDYVITHDCPAGITSMKFGYRISQTSNYLEMIRETTNFSHWFCGHMHVDEDYGKVSILYNRVVPIEYSSY